GNYLFCGLCGRSARTSDNVIASALDRTVYVSMDGDRERLPTTTLDFIAKIRGSTTPSIGANAGGTEGTKTATAGGTAAKTAVKNEAAKYGTAKADDENNEIGIGVDGGGVNAAAQGCNRDPKGTKWYENLFRRGSSKRSKKSKKSSGRKNRSKRSSWKSKRMGRQT
ncbi:hypothetical protein PRIPAC_83271, partial [Pristionchus pacificus]|uniref:Uncharacterized protein n=1 Tax=Pristionchus pacificus TaxID=54126 RepID=A0A2A6BMF4_PRIPA